MHHLFCFYNMLSSLHAYYTNVQCMLTVTNDSTITLSSLYWHSKPWQVFSQEPNLLGSNSFTCTDQT